MHRSGDLKNAAAYGIGAVAPFPHKLTPRMSALAAESGTTCDKRHSRAVAQGPIYYLLRRPKTASIALPLQD
ncbi:MAG TPA: hypothetical protein VF598_00405 [Hymenobacter sp.]